MDNPPILEAEEVPKPKARIIAIRRKFPSAKIPFVSSAMPPTDVQYSPPRKRIAFVSPHEKVAAPDLSQYEKVVLYVKKVPPNSTEPPEIILGENNLTSPIELEVNVLNQNCPQQIAYEDSLEFTDIGAGETVESQQDYFEPRISYHSNYESEMDPLDVEQEVVLPVSQERHHLQIARNIRSRPFDPMAHIPKSVADAEALIVRIFGTKFLLSNKLSETMMAVKDEGAAVFRKYIHCRDSVYLCVPCNMVRRKSKGKFTIPTINLDLGLEECLANSPPHQCQGYPLGEVIATEIDRRNRREIAAGKVRNCHAIWEEGMRTIMEISAEFGFPQHGEGGIAQHYPSWTSIRCQYNRLKRI